MEPHGYVHPMLDWFSTIRLVFAALVSWF